MHLKVLRCETQPHEESEGKATYRKERLKPADLQRAPVSPLLSFSLKERSSEVPPDADDDFFFSLRSSPIAPLAFVGDASGVSARNCVDATALGLSKLGFSKP